MRPRATANGITRLHHRGHQARYFGSAYIKQGEVRRLAHLRSATTYTIDAFRRMLQQWTQIQANLAPKWTGTAALVHAAWRSPRRPRSLAALWVEARPLAAPINQ